VSEEVSAEDYPANPNEALVWMRLWQMIQEWEPDRWEALANHLKKVMES
jgi:hypothetical protein